MSDPCGQLTGRMRAICDGSAGLPEAKRDAYRALWVERGLIPSRGLGDTLTKVFKATGVAAVAKVVEKVRGKPCGCAERAEKLNRRVPYKTGEGKSA